MSKNITPIENAKVTQEIFYNTKYKTVRVTEKLSKLMHQKGINMTFVPELNAFCLKDELEIVTGDKGDTVKINGSLKYFSQLNESNNAFYVVQDKPEVSNFGEVFETIY